jgi:hypothetical protein
MWCHIKRGGRYGSSTKIKGLSLGIAIVLAMMAISLPSRSAPDDKSNSISEFTKQLVELMGIWGKLNQATADRMKENERYLLAKAMLRLSSGFYALKVAKEDFVASIEASPTNGTIDTRLYVPAVQKLEAAVKCFSAQLTDQGARLGALSEIDGAGVESNLRKGLQEKVADLHQVAQELDIAKGSQNIETLKASIITDGNAAVAASDHLQRKSAEFAHILDPSAVLSGQPPCGIPPSRQMPR